MHINKKTLRARVFLIIAFGILIFLWPVDAVIAPPPGGFIDGWTTNIHQAITEDDLQGLELLLDQGGNVDI